MDCAASPQVAITELADFVELRFRRALQIHGTNLQISSSPSANLHLYIECDLYGMEYFHWLAWVSCLAILPPSSCHMLISQT